ncbi:DUF302 domain-containing protein [Aquisalimonas sp.]|uniref:DUF302 domain-containing protein n=1 Tax=Aquisalimonas sp. TaxID=1872621 RepID=UPI0025BB7BD0|nr:DUF302 domain-containing protein [Aquisalimonas sp.]
MKQLLTVIASLTLLAPHAYAADGMTTMESEHDVDTTHERLLDALTEAEMNVFAEVDHSAGAQEAGMELASTRLVMFGNPEVGTQLMQCGRSSAIDLPMKALIWEDDHTVYIGYNNADYLADRHDLENCDDVLQQVADALEDFANQAAGH